MNARLLSIIAVVIVAIALAWVLIADPPVTVLTARSLVLMLLVPLVVGWLAGYLMGARRSRPVRVKSVKGAAPQP